MATYVIKSWQAQNQPIEGSENYVKIEGRASGLLSWLLGLVGISPTVSLRVTADKVVYEKGSLFGSLKYLTPHSKLTSTLYGYTKPWKESIAIAIFVAVIIGFKYTFAGLLTGIVVGFFYYFLNKTMTIGYLAGTKDLSFNFKTSAIERQSIGEVEAAKVCAIIQNLVDAKHQ